MDYKKNREFNLLSKTRKKICLLPDEKEKMLPSITIDEIYEGLKLEMENRFGNSHEILEYIIFAQYYLNDPNIVYNEKFLNILNLMRNIIINSNSKYSITCKIDAMYLIDKFMEHENEDSIHFIRDLEIADGFLTLFENIIDKKLQKLLLRFFWLFAGHCEKCHDKLVDYLQNHQKTFDKIEKIISNPDQERIRKHCVLFFKNLLQFPLKYEITRRCTMGFMQIIENNEIFPPPQYFIHSVYGLCIIIENNQNINWRGNLQPFLSDNIVDLLSIENPISIYAFLTLIYWWYSKGEIIEDFDPCIILNFFTYENPSFRDNYVQEIRYVSARVIDAFASRGEKLISPLIDNGLLDAVTQFYPDSEYKNKRAILLFSCRIALKATTDDKIQMVNLGFLDMFVESIDESDETTVCLILNSIINLFRSCQEFDYNVCIDLIQKIPGYEIIFDIAANEDTELESTQLASTFAEEFFNFDDDNDRENRYVF